MHSRRAFPPWLIRRSERNSVEAPSDGVAVAPDAAHASSDAVPPRAAHVDFSNRLYLSGRTIRERETFDPFF